jgi:hypothetical protein
VCATTVEICGTSMPWDTSTDGDDYADEFQEQVRRDYREWLRLKPVANDGPKSECGNCGRMATWISGGRCRACQAYWVRTGVERPREAEAKLVERRKRRSA